VTAGADRIHIEVLDEGQTARLEITEGPSVSEPELRSALEAARVRLPLCPEVLTEVLRVLAEPAATLSGICVARGRPPLPSRDASLECAASFALLPGSIREDGSFDYYERELLKPVERGTVIARLLPEQPGVPGLRVDGTEIPVRPARPLRERLLPGVRLEADGTIVAARNGVILFKPGVALDVVDHHVHRGSVDLRSGHLTMDGSLVVEGDVLHPLRVVATGDLFVRGNVENASITAGGQVVVRGGVRGSDGGQVTAEGSAQITRAESARIHSQGALEIKESLASDLAAHEIDVKGRMRGGRAQAETSVVVREAGAPHGTQTLLLAGEPLDNPITDAERLIQAQKTGRRLGITKTRCVESQKSSGKVVRRELSLKDTEIEQLLAREQRRESLAGSATIEVGHAHPGVTLRIGHAEVMLGAPVHSARFRLDPERKTLVQEKTHP